jgi:hypothetical protein
LIDKSERLNSPEVLNSTEQALDDIEIIKIEPESPVKDYTLLNSEIANPISQTPVVFHELERNPIVNNTSVLDILLEQPLSYMIFTRYQNYDTWTNGLLRRSLALPEFNPTKWEYIDIDHNTSTGADDGNTLLTYDPHHEIRIRLTQSPFEVKDTQIPRPLQGIDGSINASGGLQIEIEKLVNNTFPLEAYVIKSISYEGNNYIWVIGFEFQKTPGSFNLTVIADSVKLIGGKVDEFITYLLSGNLSDISDISLAEVNGPYTLNYETNTAIPSVAATIGLVKVENYTLTDKSWIQLRLDKADHENTIPTTGEVFMDSMNIEAPIDTLRWLAGESDSDRIPVILTIKYFEERDEIIFASVLVNELPGFFEFVIDYTTTVDDVNVTIIDYEASEVVHELVYNGYLYPNYRTKNNLEYYNATNLKLVDIPKKFHMETTTDIASQVDTGVYYTPQTGLVANIIDNLVLKLSNRLYRIGKYLKYAADSVMTLPNSNGWAVIDAYDEHFTEIEFYRSSGNYITRDGNFIAFFDDSYVDPFKYDDPDYVLGNIAMSGRFSHLKFLNISFKTNTHLEVKLQGGTDFNALIIKGNEFTHAHVSNLPNYLLIESGDNGTMYSTVPSELEDYEDESDFDQNKISEFKIISVVGQQYLQMKVKDIPNTMTFKRPPGNIVFDVPGDQAIGSFEFQITNNSYYPLYGVKEGHYAYISQTQDYNIGSGRLSGVKHIEYNPEQFGTFALKLEEEAKFQLIFNNELDKKLATSGRMIIDPLPSDFSMELPGIANRSQFLEFPEVTNVSDITEFSNIFFVLGNLGNEIIDLMGNISNSLIQSIGNIGTNFAFTYSLETYNVPLDIIADIERGNWELLEDEPDVPSISWTHGISLIQHEYQDISFLKAHVYLQGLPQRATFESRLVGDDVYIKLDFDDYSPIYDWLQIDIKGVQDRDVDLYLTGLRPNIDFYAEANLTMNLSVAGQITGTIQILTADRDCPRYAVDEKAQGLQDGSLPGVDLGKLYIKMTQYAPIFSYREILVAKVPARFYTNLALTTDLSVKYQASEEIDYFYAKLSKFALDRQWHHSYVIFHELPLEFELGLESNPDFDMDEPLPTQGLPTIKIDTSTQEQLDVYIDLDGRTVGQRPNYEIYIGDAPNILASMSGDVYKFRSLDGKLGALEVKLTNLPIRDNYKVDKFELIGEDIKGFDIKINTIFGVLPYIEVDTDPNNDGENVGRLEINLNHQIELFGKMVKAEVALVDIVYTDAGGGNFPTSMPIYFNSIAMDMSKSKYNIIIPAPIVSVFTSTLSG